MRADRHEGQYREETRLAALWKAVSCEFKRDNMIIEVNGGESVAKS